MQTPSQAPAPPPKAPATSVATYRAQPAPHPFRWISRLPRLEFNSSLQLVQCSDTARAIFGQVDGHSACWFLRSHEVDGKGEDAARETKEQLTALVLECKSLSWGEGVTLECYTGPEGARQAHRYQAVVESTSDQGFAVLLLQPTLPTLSSPPASPRLASNSSLYAPSSQGSNAGSRRRNSTSSSQAGGNSTADGPSFEPPVNILAGMPASQRPRLNDDAPPRPLEDILRKIVAPPPVAEESEPDEDRAPDCKDLSTVEMERMLEALPVMCFEASNLGHTTWFNGEWYRYTGLSIADSFNYDRWASLFHPDDLEYVLPLWTEKMRTGEPFRFEYRVKKANGSMRWHVCQGRASKDEEGKVLSWACSVTDVEELVRARSEAMQVREHMRAVMSGANVVLVAVNLDGTITFFEGSTSAARSYGSKQEGKNHDEPILVGSTALSEVWPDPRLKEGMQQVIDGEKTSWTKVLDYNDGEQHVRFRAVPLLGGPGRLDDEMTGLIIVGGDLTETVKTQEALQLAHREQADLKASETAANEASRLKTAFLTVISHEIRTPIAGILGICELLMDDSTLSEGHRSLVGKAIRSGEILLDLVGMVLDVRKIEAGELSLEEEPFELESVIADARLFSIQAHRNDINFVEDVAHFYEAPLLGDRQRLRQVLANALSNSIKFTKKGAITLRVRQERETEDTVHVLLEVEDTGVGIPADVLPTLFQPFKQADASTARHYGGTGLGLVITRQLVELMGGTVDLKSTYGKGTTISAHVPLRKAPFVHHRQESTKTPEPELGGHDGLPKIGDIKVLLAEDNELLRDIVTKTLLKMKFQVDAVEDGAAAVAAASSKYYDVILMDGQMPGLDGYQATSQLRRSEDPRVRNVKIIALTASAIQGDRERCLEAGMDGYLAKPVRAKDLEAEIWSMLRQEKQEQ